MTAHQGESMHFGYALSSEEHEPLALIDHAVAAEEAGFEFALISDHFHPWIDKQGESPFVWSVLGAIAARTHKLRVGTGVTCPTIRIHPAIMAQAAATTAALFEGRFFFGIGTGENLNEHITGERWPATEIRREMLAEAVEVMKKLWEGGLVNHRGRHYSVENARLYTLPDEIVDVIVAAGGPEAAELAAEIGDGIVSTTPDGELLSRYAAAGGGGPRYAQVTVCWAETESAARATAFELWPNAGLKGPSAQELPLPSHFEQSAQMLTEDDIAEVVACGPDPERHLDAIRKFADAGFDHIYIHQVGPDQRGFLDFYEQNLAPELVRLEARELAAAGQPRP
jgi:coenzyme F420-dependent glucose-6-phosphate dehydrogenase